MIKDWLVENKRTDNGYFFEVIDLEQLKEIDESLMSYFGDLVLGTYTEKDNLKFHFSGKNPDDLKDYLKMQVFPNIEEFDSDRQNQLRKNVMQGDFGEILSSDFIQKIRNLSVPVIKMRLKLNNNKSVFCTDIFAHNRDGKITDLTYYEVKTRLNNNKKDGHYIGYIAANSLVRDMESENVDAIADFLQKKYYTKAKTAEEFGNMDIANECYALSKEYMDIVHERCDLNREYEVILIMEKSKYSDSILDDLKTLDFGIGNLRITVLLIDDLKGLYMNAFDSAHNCARDYIFGEIDHE